MLAAITPGFLTGGASDATYLAFLAQITAKATTIVAGTAAVENSGGNLAARATLTSPGAMAGTSWAVSGSAHFVSQYGVTNYSGAARHMFPDEATWAAGLAAGDQVYLYVSFNAALTSAAGITRNGLPSSTFAEDEEGTLYNTSIVREFAYFDRLLDKARVVLNPYSSTIRSIGDFNGSFAN